MVRIHGTKKLLDRVNCMTTLASPSTTLMGDWYATVLFWKPQVALLVNEKTLLPVLMPLAPVADLALRFPRQLSLVLSAHCISQNFIDFELDQLREVQFAKTSNRSVVGTMNEFSYLARIYRNDSEANDLLQLSIRLAETPCGPLYKSLVTPANELKYLAESSY